MLINNAKLNSKKLKKYQINKKYAKNGQNKRQKNIVLPIRKEKEAFEIKTKDMIHLLLHSKFSSDNIGKISRNSKANNSNNEKNILTFPNKTYNSIIISISLIFLFKMEELRRYKFRMKINLILYNYLG
jgi:hypothetical protein